MGTQCIRQTPAYRKELPSCRTSSVPKAIPKTSQITINLCSYTVTKNKNPNSLNNNMGNFKENNCTTQLHVGKLDTKQWALSYKYGQGFVPGVGPGPSPAILHGTTNKDCILFKLAKNSDGIRFNSNQFEERVQLEIPKGKYLWKKLTNTGLTVKQRSSIKIGKTQLIYKGLLTNKQIKHTLSESQHKIQINFSQQSQCRFCLEPCTSENNPLLIPCKCTGTLNTIHQRCLSKWIFDINNQKYEGTKKRCLQFKVKHFQCELCRHSFIQYIWYRVMVVLEGLQGVFAIFQVNPQNKKRQTNVNNHETTSNATSNDVSPINLNSNTNNMPNPPNSSLTNNLQPALQKKTQQKQYIIFRFEQQMPTAQIIPKHLNFKAKNHLTINTDSEKSLPFENTFTTIYSPKNMTSPANSTIASKFSMRHSPKEAERGNKIQLAQCFNNLTNIQANSNNFGKKQEDGSKTLKKHSSLSQFTSFSHNQNPFNIYDRNKQQNHLNQMNINQNVYYNSVQACKKQKKSRYSQNLTIPHAQLALCTNLIPPPSGPPEQKILLSNKCLIGRSKQCQYQIDDKHLKEVNTVLQIRDGKLVIWDNNSEFGTYCSVVGGEQQSNDEGQGEKSCNRCYVYVGEDYRIDNLYFTLTSRIK